MIKNHQLYPLYSFEIGPVMTINLDHLIVINFYIK